ncbi:MAG TPA: ATP synthase F1 subunit gamma [Bryobacteraceae bacterium]|nr:ATP synthase F1 subunit gamma [Bryobacteraceae bacterium]
MPSLIDIRRRIRSVKNTQQITKAMKMVSAAKLRRAQERVVAARPYGAMLHRVLSNVAAAAAGNEEIANSPLLKERPERRIQLILFTSDRGLAGAFNGNLLKATQRFIEERREATIELELVGRKGRDFYRRRSYAISGDHIGILNKPAYSDASGIARRIIERFENDEIDSVYVIYNAFKSVMSQELTVRKILPVTAPQGEPVDYIFEQPVEQMMTSLLPKYVDVQVYTAMLETAAAEHAARMTAMDSATSNAADVIENLTLYMNRVRQASITREIIEVVSGASALE